MTRPNITARQRKAIRLATRLRPIKEAASKLGISAGAYRNLLNRAYYRLGVKDRHSARNSIMCLAEARAQVKVLRRVLKVTLARVAQLERAPR